MERSVFRTMRMMRGTVSDVLDEIDQERDYETIPKEFFNITKIDDILRQFFAQNPISGLLEDHAANQIRGSVFTTYKFDGVTYDATYDTWGYRTNNGLYKYILTIRLSSDGYRFVPQSQQMMRNTNSTNHPTRGTGGWYVMNERFIADMAFLNDFMAKMNCTVTFLYNWPANRMELHFHDNVGELQFIVSLHNGHPRICQTSIAEYYREMGMKRISKK